MALDDFPGLTSDFACQNCGTVFSTVAEQEEHTCGEDDERTY
ncbi:MAG: hypothetical protein ABEK12_03085 [Candidatus Nanohaloarchaea archaeon]